jgi:hypothetical protein
VPKRAANTKKLEFDRAITNNRLAIAKANGLLALFSSVLEKAFRGYAWRYRVEE